jgi:Bifunctional DNA primase/polymerase, N-terminal
MGGHGQGSTDAASQQRQSEAVAATQRGAVFLLPPRSKEPSRPGWNCTAPSCADQRHVHATRAHAELRRRFAAAPAANYGIIPSAGLFVLDLDGATLDFDLPATVTTITGGGADHRHLWFALPAAMKGTGIKGTIGVVAGVDVVGGAGGSPQYVVGPGCIHPDTGKAYQWAPGLAPDETPIATAPLELVALLQDAGLLVPPGEAYAATSTTSIQRPGNPASQLGNGRPKTQTRTPAIIPRGARWRTVQSLLGRAWNDLDTTPADLNALAVTLHQRCEVTPADPYTLAEARESARYVASKPKHTTPTKTPGTRRMVQAIAKVAALTSMHGTRGHNCRKLLAVYLDTGRRCNTLDVSLSDRKAAEVIGTSKLTANRTRKTLIDLGFLRTLTATSRGNAATYRLTNPVQKKRTELPTKATPREDGLVYHPVRFSADPFRHGKGRLGSIGRLVLDALDGGGTWKNAAELAAALHLKPRTVQAKLRQLEEKKLASKGKAGWRRGRATLTLTFHKRDRDITLHQLQRWLRHAKMVAAGWKVTTEAPTITEKDWQRLGAEMNSKWRLELFQRLVAAHKTAPAALQAKLAFLHTDSEKVVTLRTRETGPLAAPERTRAPIMGERVGRQGQDTDRQRAATG